MWCRSLLLGCKQSELRRRAVRTGRLQKAEDLPRLAAQAVLNHVDWGAAFSIDAVILTCTNA